MLNGHKVLFWSNKEDCDYIEERVQYPQFADPKAQILQEKTKQNKKTPPQKKNISCQLSTTMTTQMEIPCLWPHEIVANRMWAHHMLQDTLKEVKIHEYIVCLDIYPIPRYVIIYKQIFDVCDKIQTFKDFQLQAFHVKNTLLVAVAKHEYIRCNWIAFFILVDVILISSQ